MTNLTQLLVETNITKRPGEVRLNILTHLDILRTHTKTKRMLFQQEDKSVVYNMRVHVD